MPTVVQCATCHFWVKRDDDSVGECHRYPPTFEHPGDQFPQTKGDQWCGEWKKK